MYILAHVAHSYVAPGELMLLTAFYLVASRVVKQQNYGASPHFSTVVPGSVLKKFATTCDISCTRELSINLVLQFQQ
jgi:hypothetical protein